MDFWRPNALLLGPGGAKGFLMIGSLLLFEKCKMLKDVKKIVGVSMGAIIGLFFNIGCSVTEILEIGLVTELSELITNIDVMSIMKNHGLVSHDIFRKRMREKVIQKYGFVPNLKQLYMMTGIELEVVSTNLDLDRAEYLSYQTEPELCCVEAVIMSMSLPLFFYTYNYKNNIYLDGAIADPFPLSRFSNESVLAIRMMGSNLDPKGSFFNYISKVIHCMTSQTRNLKKTKDTHILDLSYDVNDAIGVKLTFEKRVDMVMVGYLRAHQFLQSIKSKYIHEIEQVTPPTFFDAITIKIHNPCIEPLEYDSQEIEDEGDEYLEECFESSTDSFTSISQRSESDSEESDSEESDSEESAQEELDSEEQRQYKKLHHTIAEDKVVEIENEEMHNADRENMDREKVDRENADREKIDEEWSNILEIYRESNEDEMIDAALKNKGRFVFENNRWQKKF